MSNDSNKLSPEKSFWGWPLLVVAIILSCIFMGIFYLAIENEPDYMPSKQQKSAQQHDMSQMNQDMKHDNIAHEGMSQEDMTKMDHMNASASEPMHGHHQ
ncbi:hypothetical protein [Acinetobacter wuhouensis]|uniref:DUF4199 domain-containing protein n=1 Tax=Acinetobacter wuhouensis TaxID=1879050 RepID=A0A3G2SYD7_9GAMM|nr:hypothetical protein [Acinetobacter wuhouensis]AYO52899.1 DUF4199 domain-containing protein [Acinetobacter wuhouensis]